jgi:glycerol-3-phosphate acyltransferase PlsY
MNWMMVVIPLLGYFSGSLPFALWITHLVRGVDVRDGGSGHVTTTNTIRQAGWAAGVAVFLLDFSKGLLPTYLSARFGLEAWQVGLTAALAVIGHCWPIFAGFRGGLATGAGSLFAVSPLGMLVALGVLLFFVLVLHHAARGSAITGLLTAPVFWTLGWRGLEFWVALLAGVMIFIRFLDDWRREYRELWLDREKND